MIDVLITGAAGQVGRALLAAAPAHWRCRGLTRAELDLDDPEQVIEVLGAIRPKLLINAAAYTAVDAAEQERGVAFDTNARAVLSLALQMRHLGGKLVHLSSDYVFDGAQSRAYRPDDECRPLSIYGHSKLAGEQMAGSEALIVRTSWVYAAAGTNFLNTMLRLMVQQREVRVVTDQIGAPTWADRLAEVIWRLASGSASGIYHYSDAGAATWYDFAVAIAEEAGALGLLPHPARVVPISSVDLAQAATRPRLSLLDSSATLQATQLEPVHWRTNLRAALKQVVAMRRANSTDVTKDEVGHRGSG